MDKDNPFDYILTEESTFKTLRVPITGSKDWNMHEHIERCTNVSNGWFHSGSNDGLRPYKDIVTPVKNVALRSEGFDVKDIVPFVDNPDEYYKSFLVKKYHPQWARKYEIDTFLDDLVESSVVYDLALIKNCNNERPDVVPLQEIAFCDQTDILSGPLCLKHYYSPSEMMDYASKWDTDKVDEAITMSKAEKTVGQANDQVAKTPGKYIEVYELHGNLPNAWLQDREDAYLYEVGKYSPQLHIVCFYKSDDGKKHGISLWKGPEKKPVFKALVINKVFGRACGKSLIETLFEPQVWANWDEIKIKSMLEAALVLLQTDSEEFGNQKLTKLKNNTILKHEPGRPITQVNTQPLGLDLIRAHQDSKESDARILGSASEGSLGISPAAGTPFKLQDLVVQQGQGIHEYRQGKIATFVSDQLYRYWVLKYLVNDMNGGKSFSEELSMDEMLEVCKTIATNKTNKKIMDLMLSGKVVTQEDKDRLMAFYSETFKKGGNRKFFQTIKDELSGIPTSVYVNIAGKQKNLAKNADSITNLIRAVLANPAQFQQVPGLAKTFNELLESSGLSPVDFSTMTGDNKTVVQNKPVPSPLQVNSPAPVGA